MMRLKLLKHRPVFAGIFMLLPFVIPGNYICAQIGQAGSPSSGTQANPLPLSGRTGQSGSVTAIQTPISGTTTSINTINSTIQVQGPFAGSALSVIKKPFSGKLSLMEAIQRGLGYNLGAVSGSQAVRQAQGQSRSIRSALLPNLNGAINETVEQVNLQALGIRIKTPVPGFTVPSLVGPFNFIDFRAHLSQTIADSTAWNNYRSARETVRSSEYLAKDARDLVVLAVAGQYLEVIAAQARVRSAQAQLETANALYEQTSQMKSAGLVAQIDVNRSQVQALTQKQRLTSLQNNLAKLKIGLARSIGLAPTDQYDITDDVPFSPAPQLALEDALKQAFQQRSDLKAAQAQVRAAERERAAARGERLPSVAVNADYGVIGTTPSQSHGTFSVTGTLRIPLWQGGRTEGDIEQAGAALAQRRAELEDVKSQIEAEVRNDYLDLLASASQVEVAGKNLETGKQTLELSRQRLQAGIATEVEVVQAQDGVASAELDYINSIFAHNLAKLSLARSLGSAGDNLQQFIEFH
jgi:outer membrane protein TolC